MYRFSPTWRATLFPAFALLLAVGLAACHHEEPAAVVPNNVLSDSMRKIVTFDTVRLSPLKEEISLTGKVTSDEDHVVKIFPPVSGNVTDVNVSLGDFVQKGQQLASIRSSDISGYQSQSITAQSNQAIAKRALDQTKDKYENGIASQVDLINAQQQYNIANAEVERVNQVLALYGGNTAGGIYRVSAPIAGFVVEKKITEGQIFRPDNTDNAFTIAELNDVWVLANVFESDISHINLGDKVKIYPLAYPDRVYDGTISKIPSIIDPDAKVSRVRIVLQNPNFELKPDMFVNVKVEEAKKGEKALSISKNAVYFDNNRTYVVVYDKNGKLHSEQVVPITIVGDRMYIKNRLDPGTVIISKYQDMLYNSLNQQ